MAGFARRCDPLGHQLATPGHEPADGRDVARHETHRLRLLTAIPREGAGVYLSHNTGYDFATLPQWFTLGELHKRIIASNAAPVGFVHEMALRLGRDTPISRDDFFDYGLCVATGYQTTIAGSAAQVADRLEEVFEATGSRGGFMLGHTVSMPADLIRLVDLLIPKLQRRGRFRTEYKGRTLRENLLDDE